MLRYCFHRAIFSMGLVIGVHTTLLARQDLTFRSFGISSFQTTNFDSVNYKHGTGWIEGRVQSDFLGIEILQRPLTLYGFGVFSGSETHAAHEHNFKLGLGIEHYTLSELLPDELKEWVPPLKYCRTFVDVAHIFHNDTAANIPERNLRLGIDLWYEKNVLETENELDSSRNGWWYDLWMQWAFQSTNFKDAKYHTTNLAAVGHFGFLQMINKAPIYPYILAELNVSGKRYFWENRASIGAGLRFLPRKKDAAPFSRLAFFFEGRWAVVYFKDDPQKLPSISYDRSSFPRLIENIDRPRFDLRFGINYSFGKWWNYTKQSRTTAAGS